MIQAQVYLHDERNVSEKLGRLNILIFKYVTPSL